MKNKTNIRYHINMKTEMVNICRAKPGRCPLRKTNGSEVKHYATKELAEKALESMYRDNFPTLQKTPKVKKHHKVVYYTRKTK